LCRIGEFTRRALALPDDEFKKLSVNQIDKMFRNVPNSEKIIVDVKGIFNKEELKEEGYVYWSL
jgi:UDP-N-acetyl-D-galactosamine dehydrogenase